MVSQDLGFQIKELSRKVAEIESLIERLDKRLLLSDSIWDNATLMREWGICKRTAANYRQQGLEFFKRGGIIFYSSESRLKFINKKKSFLNRKELNNGK